MVAKQKVWLGRQWARMTVTIHVSETTLAIELRDGDTKVVRRTTDQAVRNITSMRPRTALLIPRRCVKEEPTHQRQAPIETGQAVSQPTTGAG